MNKDLTFKQAQKELHAMIVELAGRDDETIYWPPHQMLARLTEEVGELAREINAEYGKKRKQNHEEQNIVAEELADVLQTTLLMANALDVNLEKELLDKIDVIKKRDSKRFK